MPSVCGAGANPGLVRARQTLQELSHPSSGSYLILYVKCKQKVAFYFFLNLFESVKEAPMFRG